MGRSKARFLMADQYGRYVVALRCAELLHARQGEDGPIEVRQEDSRLRPWDDLSEVHEDSRQRKTRHVWQVKRQTEQFKAADLEPLFRALHASPDHIGHFACMRLVDVKNVGALTHLSEFCERLRQPGFDLDSELELTRAEKKWLQFVQKLLGCSEQESLKFLGRLDVVELGNERRLRKWAIQLLERHFAEPETAHVRLLTFLANYTDGAISITRPLLEQEVFKNLERHLLPGMESLASLRAAYLDATRESYSRLSPLRSLMGRGAVSEAPRLAEVFAMPTLRLLAEGEAAPRLTERTGPPRGSSSPTEGTDEDKLLQQFEHLRALPEEVRLVELLLDPRRLVERPRHFLEGSVGTGKSTLLEYLRFRLAQRARDDPEAPLPIKLEARHLVGGVAKAALQGARRLDPKLVGSAASLFIYLVDGLDEVEPRLAREVQDCLAELDLQPSTVALVMAGRPATSYVSFPFKMVRLQVVPWTRSQVEEFLDRWRQHAPEQVAPLDTPARFAHLLPVLTHPLTATFAIVLAQESPESLGSRASLFRGIEEKLFLDWERRRAAEQGTAIRSWADIAPAFRGLALESLKSGRDELSIASMRRHLGRDAMDRQQEWIDEAHRRFGLLVCQDDGAFRFVLRGLAEHLAGAALLAQGKRAILEAAQERWGEEPVRHAIGLGAEQEGLPWAIDMVRSLLPDAEKIMLSDVRLMQVVALVATDLGKDGAPFAEDVAEALAGLLTLETSVWIPQAVAGFARELARLGGPCWEALLRRLKPLLADRRSRAHWYLAQSGWSREQWLNALKQRDVAVRRVALEKLSAWVDDPQVRRALLAQFYDETHPYFHTEPPAHHAGLILRRAARDEHFRETMLPELLTALREGEGLMAGAAALALHPHEAPVELLVRGIQELGRHRLAYPEVLESLSATPEAKAAWDSVMKDLPSMELREEQPLDASGTRVEGSPPLSAEGYGTLLTVIGPAVARWSSEERQKLPHDFEGREVTQSLCEAAREHPEAILELIREPRLPWFTPAAELHLGEAAVRHADIRAALLARWKQREGGIDRSTFPGGALSSLVVKGDGEAAEVYAEWLNHTQWLQGLLGPAFLSPTALRHPTVRPVAIARAREVWRKYRDGEMRDGQRVHLAGSSMASVLSTLRPAWEEGTELQEEILEHTRLQGDYALTNALGIYVQAPHPPALSDLLVERFQRENADPAGISEAQRIATWLSWAERAQLTGKLQDVLGRICTWDSWLRYKAASILIRLRPGQTAAVLSAKAAANWPDRWSTYFLRRTTLARLVQANRDAWHRRLLKLLQEPRLRPELALLLARVVGPLLPPQQKDALNNELYRELGQLEDVWLLDDERGRDRSIRCADLCAQVIFEMGGRLTRRSLDSTA